MPRFATGVLGFLPCGQLALLRMRARPHARVAPASARAWTSRSKQLVPVHPHTLLCFRPSTFTPAMVLGGSCTSPLPPAEVPRIRPHSRGDQSFTKRFAHSLHRLAPRSRGFNNPRPVRESVFFFFYLCLLRRCWRRRRRCSSSTCEVSLVYLPCHPRSESPRRAFSEGTADRRRRRRLRGNHLATHARTHAHVGGYFSTGINESV